MRASTTSAQQPQAAFVAQRAFATFIDDGGKRGNIPDHTMIFKRGLKERYTCRGSFSVT